MSLLQRWAFPAAAACLVASLALWRLVPWLTRLRWALLIAGGLLLLASLVLNAGTLRAASGRRAARYGAGAAVLIVLALGVAVLANALSVRHNARWDLTENRRQSLSPQSIKVLGSLPGPVEAIAFFRGDTPGRRTAEDLLKLYGSFSNGKFTWRMEDPDRSPGLAQRYGVDTYGTVILERGGKAGDKVAAKSEKVLDADEERLTNGLLKLTRDAKRVIYLLKGHGESDPANSERPGFSQAKEQMEKANYEVKEITLARDPNVPGDAAMVIVAGPKTDLLAARAGRAGRLHRPGRQSLLHARALPGRWAAEIPRPLRLRGGGRPGGRAQSHRARLRARARGARGHPVRGAPDHAGSFRAHDACSRSRARST